MLLFDDPGRFGVEAVADAEVGVDVGPARRALLQLLAQLADEDVDRAVAVGHRIAPDPLVDRLALEHLALAVGEQVQQLELAAGQVEALTGGEGLELIWTDLQLTGGKRTGLGFAAAAAPAAADRFHPRHRLLGMAGLGDPVVDPEPQAPHPLGDGRAAGADDHAEIGELAADAVEVLPGFIADHSGVDQHRVQLHRDHFLGRHGAGRLAQLPAGRLRPLGEDGDEAAVGVDDAEPDGLL